jgi:hypothetical protein
MTGRKDYVTLEDIKKFVAPANPFSVRGYLETLLETPGEDTEQVQAYVQLLDVIEQDEALQYAAFSNTTTDDVSINRPRTLLWHTWLFSGSSNRGCRSESLMASIPSTILLYYTTSMDLCTRESKNTAALVPMFTLY